MNQQQPNQDKGVLSGCLNSLLWIGGLFCFVIAVLVWTDSLPGFPPADSTQVPANPTLRSRSTELRQTPAVTPVPTIPLIEAHTLHASNLRTGPGLEFDIVEVIAADDTVMPTGRTANGEWLKLARGTWIFAELVDFESSRLPVMNVESEESQRIEIKAGSELRSGPSIFHEQSDNSNSAESFDLLGRNHNATWLAVRKEENHSVVWVQVNDTTHLPIPLDRLPVQVSHDRPDTESVFNYLVRQTVYQTTATQDIHVTVQNCGRANAFAITQGGRRYVVMCQEMLTRMWTEFNQLEEVFPSPLEYITAAASGILAVALHEYAHLLMKDPLTTQGIHNLGRSVAKAQDIVVRYGTTFNEDMADLYATVILIELAKALATDSASYMALPADYVALGPIMANYVLANRQAGGFVWSSDATHSPSPDRLAASICAFLDGTSMYPLFSSDLLRLLHDHIYGLTTEQGRTCLAEPDPDLETYAALLAEIEGLFRGALPAWW